MTPTTRTAKPSKTAARTAKIKEIRAVLNAENRDLRRRAVQKAIVVLYARQTADEQATEQTRHLNARGFTAADAKRCSFVATFLAKGGNLKDETVARYARRVSKYAGQLADIAAEKAAAKAADAMAREDYDRDAAAA